MIPAEGQRQGSCEEEEKELQGFGRKGELLDILGIIPENIVDCGVRTGSIV